MASRNVHRLQHLDRDANTAVCMACGRVDVVWKSRGKNRPRVGVCKVAYDLDRRQQRLKQSDTAYAVREVQKIRSQQQYLAEKVGLSPILAPDTETASVITQITWANVEDRLFQIEHNLRVGIEAAGNKRTKALLAEQAEYIASAAEVIIAAKSAAATG